MILRVETKVREEFYDLIYDNRSSGVFTINIKLQATLVNEVVLVFYFVSTFTRFTPSADSFICRSAVLAAKFDFQTKSVMILRHANRMYL